MLLEKIKEHGGKIMFFVMNMLVVATGVLLIRQKNTEDEMEKTAAASMEVDLQNYKAVTDYAVETQQRVKAEKETKISSIANNPDTIQKQEVVPVKKTVPAVTKTVTVKKPSSSSSSSSSSKSSSSSSAKTTTKTS